MRFAEIFLQQLGRETTSTRRLLEQVPDGKSDWKPHPKSMPLGYLSFLVAIMPSWIASIIERDFLDLAAGGASQQPSSSAELIELFENSVATARRALENTNEEVFTKTWQLRVGGKVVDEKTRHAMIEETFTHFAHHRGQLTVYLRLNDRSLPSIYGPTA